MVLNVRPLMAAAGAIEKRMPGLRSWLAQADIKDAPAKYVAKGLLTSTASFALVFGALGSTVLVTRESASTPLLLALVVAGFLFASHIMRPRMIVKRRIRGIESNLAFGLSALEIELNSGVHLVDAIGHIGESDYGELSKEFDKTIGRIRSGDTTVESLEELGRRNPSMYLRRAVWQLVNTLKTGGDILDNLTDINKSLGRDQMSEGRRYGGKLAPLSTVYMMIAIIIPALLSTFMISVSSIQKGGGMVTEETLWTVLLFTALMQVVFLFIMSTNRPALVGE